LIRCSVTKLSPLLDSMGDNNPNNQSSWADAASNRWAGAKEKASGLAAQAKEFATHGRGPYPEPGGKGAQMKYGCQDYAEPPDDYIVTLEWDLANTYYWSGHFCQDWIFFVCQWHPLLGILLCHPYHPWTKADRLKMFIISTALTMIPAIAVSKWVANNLPEDNEAARKTATKIGTLLFVTIPDIIIGVVLYQLSIANTRCPVCSCWESISKFCNNCFLCIGLTSCGISYLMLKDHPNDLLEALKPLAYGKGYSLATWFPIWYLLPCVGYWLVWRGERLEAEKALNNNAPGVE